MLTVAIKIVTAPGAVCNWSKLTGRESWDVVAKLVLAVFELALIRNQNKLVHSESCIYRQLVHFA